MKDMLLFAFDMNCVAHQSQGLWRHLETALLIIPT